MIPAPPFIVWEWLNDINKRLQWQTFDDIRPSLRPEGRTGVGAQNHCAHGKNVVLEKIVDWRPFEHYTTELPVGFSSQHLEPLSDGTRFNSYFKLKMPLPRWLRHILAGLMTKMQKMDEQFDTLVQLIETDMDKLREGNDDQN
jgi:hypothetical protein